MNDGIEKENGDEEVLLVVHKHWAALVPEMLFTLVPGAAVAGLLAAMSLLTTESAGGTIGHAIVTLLLPPCFLILWTILALQWTNYYLDILVLTDRRLFYASQANFIQRTISEWNIADVRHVGVRFSNLFESFFNYGSIEIEARGQRGAVAIGGLPDPGYVSAMILKQDDRYGTLKETARKQRELLHFVSHEVKGHLAKSKAAFAAILEGDYGTVPASLQSVAGEALADTQKGVDTVMSILDNPDEKGDMRYERRPFDLSATVHRAAAEFEPRAKEKGLLFRAEIEPFCAVIGDEQKIERHVIRNLLENALRYTPAGQVRVKLERTAGSTIRLTVADTGVGIAAADVDKLFTEGGHGEHSKEVNPESTGYGLFVAKKVMAAHGGTIWARSAGPGSGSQFFAEFLAA